MRRSLAALLFLACSVAAAASEEIVDLELVLAIDVSSSVSTEEYRLQMNGYAAAFRDPRVQAAIASGPTRRIGVSALLWADATVPKFEIGWFTLATEADCAAFSDVMAALPRGTEGGTGIGSGIAAAIRKFDRNGLTAERQTVDVSGDGRETPARENIIRMPAARSMADARGVVINGLAIASDDSGLPSWYRNHVITGPGAFVIGIDDFPDFAEAITRKLVREIEYEARLSQR